MNTKLIKEIIKERNSDALFLEEEFDEAIIGTGKTKGKNISASYDSDKCISILVENYDMNEIEAMEQFQNSIDAMKDGDNNPIFFTDFTNIKDLTVEDLKTAFEKIQSQSDVDF